MLFEFDQFAAQKAKIKVLGVGGAGGNAINRMITSGMNGVEFIAINTDAQDLDSNPAETKIQIGKDLTKGLGAGAKPEVGRKAIMHDKEAVASIVAGADLVFVTAGMGGGTGTGAAPVVAKICKDLGILTVCIVTLPFNFEGPKKMSEALKGVSTMRNFCDTLIVIPNEKLLSVIDYNTTLEEGFAESDSVLLQAAQSISDLINKQGNVNIDFADVETVMSGKGDAIMGTGTARGQERAVLAAQQAICSPLLDNQSIKGAKNALLNVTGNKKMTMREVDAASKLIYEEAGKEINLIFGCVIDENMDDELKVTVIATGINKTPIEEIEIKKEVKKKRFHNDTSDLMDSRNTTLYNQKNGNEIQSDEDYKEENDGPTLVFDDFDQSADLEVPAYIRKQNR
ncbi:MAG: cell division protein FtsZ [Candidatus Neomarinimicrobiota bacterium]